MSSETEKLVKFKNEVNGKPQIIDHKAMGNTLEINTDLNENDINENSPTDELEVNETGLKTQITSNELNKQEVNPCNVEEIRRNFQKTRGIYIRGTINEIDLIQTLDTGATSTIISNDFSKKLGGKIDESVPKVYSAANGSPMNIAGRVPVEIKMGSLKLKWNVLVGDIKEDCLLGADILLGLPSGPAEILMSESRMLLDGHSIPLEIVGAAKQSFKLRLVEDCNIPGFTERLIETYIDTPDDTEGLIIVEPNPEFSEKHGLGVACSVSDPNKRTTIPVRIMNPYPNNTNLRENTCVAYAEKICRVEQFMDSENPAEYENYEVIRRVTMEPRIQENVDAPKAFDNGKLVQCENEIPEHLQDLYNRSKVGKTDEQKQMMAEMLKEYGHAFSKNEYDLGRCNLGEHHIDTGDAAPVKLPSRRVPLHFLGEDDKAVEKLKKQNAIQPSKSPWAAPMVFAFKKDNTLRPCVDYRHLNQLTVKDSYRLPNPQECLDSLGTGVYYSSLDLTAGYHQIPLSKNSIPKTAFSTRSGLWEYTVMSFGLTNAPACFQRIFELALSGLLWKTCIIYLDDCISFGATFQESVSRLKVILDRIVKANMKLKPKKCELFATEVTFLGHIVNKNGTRPDPCNVSKILGWKKCSNVTETKSFLGLCSYYRKWVKDFSAIAHPLIELTRKDRVFTWSKACDESFNKLKAALVSPQIMAYPKGDGQFILDTDASAFQIGAVISQIQDNQEKVIAYGSRTLTKAEKNYCVTDRELLSLKYFMEYYRHYLLGKRFIARVDHQAIKWIFSFKNPKNRVARWQEVLSQYDFEIQFRPGCRHGNADGMSRGSQPSDCTCAEEDLESLRCGPCAKCRKRALDMESTWLAHNQPTKPEEMTESADQNEICRVTLRSETAKMDNEPWLQLRTKTELRNLQAEDPDIGPIIQWKSASENRPRGPEVCSSSQATRHYWNYWRSLVIRDGLLCRLFNKLDGSASYIQLITPRALQKEVLEAFHDTLLAGHMGKKKTEDKIKQRFYWFGLHEDVKTHIIDCDTCEANKIPYRKPKAPLGEMKSGGPMDRICTDVIGPLPRTKRNNRFIIVMTDHWNKWAEVAAAPDESATSTARAILDSLVSRFGCMLDLHSDKGRNYESVVMQELCDLLEIRKTRTTTRHPSGNGAAEIFNKTLVRMIRAFIQGEQDKWDENLQVLAGAYRATPHTSTGLSPNFLVLGHEVRLPAEIVFGSATQDGSPVSTYGEYVTSIRKAKQKAFDIARRCSGRNAQRMKQYYDGKQFLNRYDKGDMVWVLNENRLPGICSKLIPAYIGPFPVLAKLNDRDYVIQQRSEATPRVIHHDKLKKYRGSTILSWAEKAIQQWESRHKTINNKQ